MEQQGVVSDADPEDTTSENNNNNNDREAKDDDDDEQRSDPAAPVEGGENGDGTNAAADSNEQSNSNQQEQPQQPQPPQQGPPPPNHHAAAAAMPQAGGPFPYPQPLMQHQQQGPPVFPPMPQPPAPPGGGQPMLLHFYEAQMRDHAVAYASAAAGAAWAAAQIAADMASATISTTTTNTPNGPPRIPMFPSLPMLSPPHHHHQPQPPPTMYAPYGQPPPPQPCYFDADAAAAAATATSPESNNPNAMVMYPTPDSPYNNNNSNSMYDQYQQQQPQHYQQQQHQQQHGPFQPMATSDQDSHYGSHQRRKQQRRMPQQQQQQHHHGFPPGHIWQPQQQQQQNPNSNEKRGRRRRRFRQNQDSSSGDEYRRPRVRKTMAFSNNNNNNHNSDGGGSASSTQKSGIQKKKQRQPNDESLLGKTGVSALYEWCGKRRTTPEFSLKNTTTDIASSSSNTMEVSSLDSNHHHHHHAQPSPSSSSQQQQDFEMSVCIDGMECGKGRGRTKSAAKQEAARRALQVLLPGVVFEEASGILIELPQQQQQQQQQQLNPYDTRTSSGVKWSQYHNTTNNTTTSSKTSSMGNSSSSRSNAVASSLEDLAPNLAKRLAIGHANDDDEKDTKDDQRRKGGGASTNTRATRVKLPAVYPGTSTTSDDEDENAYYASRGASICSALLHAMVQIDDRIPEAPSYTYQVSTVPQTSNAANNNNNNNSGNPAIATSPSTLSSSSQLKRKAVGPGPSPPNSVPSSPRPPPIVIHRGSFTCVATMRLWKGQDSSATASSMDNNSTSYYETLQATGVGCTKREARHTASARLLALLFPECNGLVQVKQAAEAARERYAASKALKQQSKRDKKSFVLLGRAASQEDLPSASHYDDDDDENSQTFRSASNLAFAMATSPSQDANGGDSGDKDGNSIPPIPAEVKSRIVKALEPSLMVSDDDDNDSNDKASAVTAEESPALARQLSRQNQLEDRIAAALQKLNEHDEEGRSLPDQLTADDVGRTVLRRASPEDLDWIAKLFENGIPMSSSPSSVASPISILGPAATGSSARVSLASSPGSTFTVDHQHESSPFGGCQSQALSLWSSSTIVLLLCRAIAPYDDPPLGCAALTLGFSMEKGRELRIAQLASKPHLPRERFIECLQSFARCMGCALASKFPIIKNNNNNVKRLSQSDCQKILSSHLGVSPFGGGATLERDLSDAAMSTNVSTSISRRATEAAVVRGGPPEEPLVSSSLQAVQEESDEESDSCPEGSSEKRIAKKGQGKPSKRSRVQ